jgi:endonuclease/exonuclease/phosphatase family metal-dependent hydrolase
VAGDLNEPPGGPAWLALGDALTDPGGSVAATYPAHSPRQRIDGVLVSQEVVVRAVRVPGPEDGVDRADLLAASDHQPVLADLELGPAAPAPR